MPNRRGKLSLWPRQDVWQPLAEPAVATPADQTKESPGPECRQSPGSRACALAEIVWETRCGVRCPLNEIGAPQGRLWPRNLYCVLVQENGSPIPHARALIA